MKILAMHMARKNEYPESAKYYWILDIKQRHP